jgi:hypothetical protein
VEAEREDPARELSLGAAIRDLIAGTALIAFGIWRGVSSLDLLAYIARAPARAFEPAYWAPLVETDRIHAIGAVFDALGLFWICFALYRLARIAMKIRGEGRARG